jgi:lysophospholipase L1-like esterase
MQTVAKPMSSLRLKVPQPLKIIAIGDSLIYGYGDPVGGGWVERLRRQWLEPSSPGHAIYNLGIRGDAVAQVAQRLEAEYRLRGELRHHLPNLIMLSVGVNDSPRLGRPGGRNYTDFAQFETSLAQLLNQAQRLCPVLFVGMVPVDETKMPFMDCLYYNHADQYRYKEATRQLCLERKVPYLDVFDRWMQQSTDWQRSRMTEDGLHPNVLGYQTLLQDIYAWQPFAEQVLKQLPAGRSW